jgi:hypothetical protein
MSLQEEEEKDTKEEKRRVLGKIKCSDLQWLEAQTKFKGISCMFGVSWSPLKVSFWPRFGVAFCVW